MELLFQNQMEQIVRQAGHYVLLAAASAAVLMMLSWCLAAGIMPRDHAGNYGR